MSDAMIRVGYRRADEDREVTLKHEEMRMKGWKAVERLMEAEEALDVLVESTAPISGSNIGIYEQKEE